MKKVFIKNRILSPCLAIGLMLTLLLSFVQPVWADKPDNIRVYINGNYNDGDGECLSDAINNLHVALNHIEALETASDAGGPRPGCGRGGRDTSVHYIDSSPVYVSLARIADFFH